MDGTRRQQVGTAFDYSFSVWPDETWNFDRAVYALFKMLGGRVEMTFAPDEFERFRSALVIAEIGVNHDGSLARVATHGRGLYELLLATGPGGRSGSNP